MLAAVVCPLFVKVAMRWAAALACSKAAETLKDAASRRLVRDSENDAPSSCRRGAFAPINRHDNTSGFGFEDFALGGGTVGGLFVLYA